MPGMPSHVALLRAVNLGPRNRVAMPELRRLVTSLGHEDVSTYIASGNVLFTPGNQRRGTAALATELQSAIDKALGVSTAVVVLTRKELSDIVRKNPFPQEKNPKCVTVVFRPTSPTAADKRAVAEAVATAQEKGGRDEARFVGSHLVLWTPDGYGRSPLSIRLFTSKTDGPAAAGTARNWSTVTKLLALLDS